MGVKLGPHINGINRLRVSENRVLRRMFGPEQGAEENVWT
jgi:hypothetical protein